MLKDRLKKILEEKNISLYQLAKLTGKSQGNLNDILKGRINNPKQDFFDKVYKVFPDINPTWFSTGEGEMLQIPEKPPGIPPEILDLILKVTLDEPELMSYAAKAVQGDKTALERFYKLLS